MGACAVRPCRSSCRCRRGDCPVAGLWGRAAFWEEARPRGEGGRRRWKEAGPGTGETGVGCAGLGPGTCRLPAARLCWVGRGSEREPTLKGLVCNSEAGVETQAGRLCPGGPLRREPEPRSRGGPAVPLGALGRSAGCRPGLCGNGTVSPPRRPGLRGNGTVSPPTAECRWDKAALGRWVKQKKCLTLRLDWNWLKGCESCAGKESVVSSWIEVVAKLYAASGVRPVGNRSR